MIRFLKEDIDPHKATAAWVKAAVTGVSLDDFLPQLQARIADVTKDERQAAKGINFGFLYGMREGTFIEAARKDYGVEFTLEQATIARKGYFKLYPAFAQWHKDSWKWVRLGYVDTILGRRRPLQLTDGEDSEGLLRKAVNTPVQATASDLSLLALPDIEERMEAEGLSEWCENIGFIHDEGLFAIPRDRYEDAKAIIKYEMENPAALKRLGVTCPVPLEVEFKEAETWS
jgi:DNA polymerase-1